MEKNIELEPELLEQVKAAAEEEHRTPDEVAGEAVSRYLRQRKRAELYKYGENRARELGLKEEDVPRLINESRSR